MSLEEVREVLAKFNKEEAFLDQRFIENKLNYDTNTNKRQFYSIKSSVNVNLEEAVKRNKDLIKELEITKGRLRSKAIFSPTEIQWEEICRKYQTKPSLQVTTWKCHLPIFV